MKKVRFAIVGGAGWRAQFFLRAAHLAPEQLECVGLVVRNEVKAEEMRQRWGGASWSTTAELLDNVTPEFLVGSVSNAGRETVDRELMKTGVPVLLETPASARSDLEAMREMYDFCASCGAKVQVAEQYFLRPEHAARLCAIERGDIGEVGYAQVSVAHGYHGASLIRKYLGIGYESFKVCAVGHKDRRVKTRGRGAPPAMLELGDFQQQIALISFENGKTGIFDWPGEYFTGVRPSLVKVHGERGCIVNNDLTLMKDNMDLIKLRFEIHAIGGDDLDGVLEGRYLKGIQLGHEWLYRNPFAAATLHEDEIAVGAMLLRMGDYVRGGAPVYPLEEALQDQYLDICIADACAGKAVVGEKQIWAR